MKLRTEIHPVPIPGIVSHRRPLMLLGSCFTENISSRLSADLILNVANPTGTLYNPLSIADAAERIVSGEAFSRADLFEHEGLWHSPFHHSRFSAADPDEALGKMNAELARAHRLLPDVSAVIVTLGATRVFADAGNGRVVANCHKLPASRFKEADLSVEEAAGALDRIISSVRSAAAGATVVFTVSPIRHLAYGLEGNSLSKAKLRVAIDNVANRHERVGYFPAYEIMVDDLRDYRFYDPDMKHPSALAVDYIYEKFLEACATPTTIDLAAECRGLSRRMAHRQERPPSAEMAARFADQTRALARRLLETHPYLEPAVALCLGHLNQPFKSTL